MTRRHILQAIAEYDDRGAESFLGVYGFGRSVGHTLIHDGKTYDLKAILGVAHRYATGRLATSEEFNGGKVGAAAILRKHGFEVTEPASARAARRPAPARSPRPSTRRSAAPEVPPAICPTCSMALPATGVCDTCG